VLGDGPLIKGYLNSLLGNSTLNSSSLLTILMLAALTLLFLALVSFALYDIFKLDQNLLIISLCMGFFVLCFVALAVYRKRTLNSNHLITNPKCIPNLAYAASINMKNQPQISDGFGKGVGRYQNVDFYKAVVDTFVSLQEEIEKHNVFLECLTTRQYFNRIIQLNLVDSNAASLYCKLYLKFRFSDKIIREEEFVDFLKVFAALIKSIPSK
jgi:hypothetical protein